MERHSVTFDQLPGYVFDLNRKVDQLLERLDALPVKTTLDKEKPRNLKGAAEFLGCAEQTIYQNIKSIPHHKRFGKLYFFESELLEYLKGGVPA